MNKQQLEISLPCSRRSPRQQRRQLRAARARWWFGRMRQVVDTAGSWTPASPSPLDLLEPAMEMKDIKA